MTNIIYDDKHIEPETKKVHQESFFERNKYTIFSIIIIGIIDSLLIAVNMLMFKSPLIDSIFFAFVIDVYVLVILFFFGMFSSC